MSISIFTPEILALILMFVGIVFILRYFLGIGIGAPFLPIHTRYLKSVLEEIDICHDMMIVDLGSGNGKILIEAAKRDAHVIGYELNPFLAWLSRRRLKAWKERATIYRKNLFDADISQADIIFIFGFTNIMSRLSKKIAREAKRDALIVSFAFPLTGFKEKKKKGIAYIYKI